MATATLGALVQGQAERLGDAIALRLESEACSYAELDSRSNHVSWALRHAGVRTGDRVAFLGRNSIEFVEFLIGASRIGAVVVPLNWRLAAPELTGILSDSTARLLVTDDVFVDAVEDIVQRGTALETVVVIGQSTRSTVDHLAYEEWIENAPAGSLGVGPDSEQVVLQLYTSGTTGKPKGVMSTHAAFTASLVTLADAANISPTSVSLCTLPTFHIGGLSWVLAGIARGCESIMLRDAEPAAILSTIDGRGVTTMIAVPTVVQRLVESPDLTTYHRTSLQTIYYGGGPMSELVLHRAMDAFDCQFIQGFGMTELPLISALPPDAHHGSPELLRSCGRPVPDTELRIVDIVTGEDVLGGVVGEIWARSPRMMVGYWQQEDETAAAIDADGWLHTGDAARMDERGFIYVQDRIKDMIVTGGENVYSAEVENVLMKHPAIVDCAVIGIPSKKWTETVRALVVLSGPGIVGEPELIEFCRQHLARYKCPTSIGFVSVLPRTASGKLIKHQLRRDFGAPEIP